MSEIRHFKSHFFLPALCDGGRKPWLTDAERKEARKEPYGTSLGTIDCPDCARILIERMERQIARARERLGLDVEETVRTYIPNIYKAGGAS